MLFNSGVELNSSGEVKKVWTIDDKKLNDRVIVKDRNLTISNFTVTDTGTYRVLDSNNEILITVTVTESGTGSDSKMTYVDHKTNDTEQNKPLIIGLSVSGALLGLVILAGIIYAIYKKYQRQRRNTDHYQGVPMQDIVH
ncbi:uncharacterized protein LOC143738204 [Siphateles boraxobius]|uniref:uncharacterized protein LOC143738204 n=1 Tax=Siphateles boraxobius TaxID=180520 RepID=UPI004063B381